MDDEDRARAVLDALEVSWAEVRPTRRLRASAERMLSLHSLRAADALQLAAALEWSGGAPAGHELVCLDHRLIDAAREQGFAVLPTVDQRWPSASA